ncbi:MAG: Phospho-2-dehydro-3-deoxyheptonate aldolase, Phe-sensitive [Deltaproteobacteria bacterium ADurb.BinA179]|jgi:3-deoxy-7-phosphoheptulonate synthase|nr:3-deoxy-7-phosphoheptulonate synthase [Deltaproteobacteria bacterium]MDI9543897.1 3-deoxy-7-phosphoheptulonate synthase [Pseudomonadota bacterium]OPZ28873.1 MAG: Phospho-2-dehydro-3-deoxyheptonate aldolase, Phe-sensitive [Deltaproteobacteria bacterium ADurb.BinA179]HOD72531.1 3-deoxy-7-phosphoheptulonate synthase [Deltaproteobacteria bacterium]HOS27729.1 3-deoxy-7-phosphoheptulonate synthase [Deltaproteobacteria bacterium]
MGFEYLREIPGPEEIRDEIPLPLHLKRMKEERDREIRAIFQRRSDRFFLVIGPCSADNEDAVCEYVSRLARLQDEVKDRILVIPRIYTNKPRTTGQGYKGMVHQPDPHKQPNIVEGLRAIRHMHIRALSESGLPAADEMLYPGNLPYLEDLLSYVAVGARSVENQQHRLTISGMAVPAGMKNPTSGDISVMLNSVYAGQQSHVFIYNGWEVKTSGNPLTHAILRGAVDISGRNIPNYHYENLLAVVREYTSRPLAHPLIVVDTNHSNSDKNYREQPRIGMEVMQSRRHSPLLSDLIRGLMVESYLVEGAQKLDENTYGKSITDACLGWKETAAFVRRLAEEV